MRARADGSRGGNCDFASHVPSQASASLRPLIHLSQHAYKHRILVPVGFVLCLSLGLREVKGLVKSHSWLRAEGCTVSTPEYL